MPVQNSATVRTSQAEALRTALGSNFSIELRTGPPPANPAAADTGTLLATYISQNFAAAAGGSVAMSGLPATVAAAANGTVGHFRFKAAGTCHHQGTAGQSVGLNTNAVTAAGGATLNFASTAGVQLGMEVSGTGVPPGATVVAVTSTVVTLSIASSAGVASAASITFRHDLTIDNALLVAAQNVTLNSYSFTPGGA
jgi:hypothetical protein